MSNLKTESLNKCFSLLKEFIEESGNERKGIAALALDQLARITAGTDNDNTDEIPIGGGGVALSSGDKCLTKPRGDESPGDPIGG